MKNKSKKYACQYAEVKCKYKILKLTTGVVSALVGFAYAGNQVTVSAQEVANNGGEAVSVVQETPETIQPTSTSETSSTVATPTETAPQPAPAEQPVAPSDNAPTTPTAPSTTETPGTDKAAHDALQTKGYTDTVKEDHPTYEGVTKTEKEDVQLNLIAEGERETSFNRNWRVSIGDVANGESTNLDVSQWRLIDLPNDFSIEKDTSTAYDAESGFYPGGVQWYRKNFVVPENHLDKMLSLTFDGSYMVTEIYVNGRKVATHKNGYSPFNVNITEYLHRDGVSENQVALKVTNETPSSRWYSGSGVYRDVTLVVTDKVHVAHNGVTITTPQLKEQATGNVEVNVSATIKNDTQASQLLSVIHQLFNAEGVKVAESVAQSATLQAHTTQSLATHFNIAQPTLWSLDNPYLYKLKTLVSVDGQLKDTYETDYGFRYFEFSRDTGFSLNGHNIKLKGVNNHHDNGALGAVANHDAIKRQIAMLKEMGANAIRISHNPTSRALLDEANRQGMLIVEEAFDGWDRYKNGNVKDFARFFNEPLGEQNARALANATPEMTWAEFALKSMINRGKNAPAIIMWSIGNEVTEGASGSTAHFGELARRIVGWIKEADPTRPATNGNNRIGELDAVNQAIIDAGGIVGFNYKNAATMRSELAKHPDWKVYGSETTSAIHSRGEYGTLGQDTRRLQMSEYDNESSRVGWGATASKAWEWAVENDWNAGIFVWTGFDYIGEPTPWNGVTAGSVSGQGAVPNSSYFGIIDTAGFPKDTYWLYRSMWQDKDYTLSLMSTWNDQEIAKQNGQVQVDVYTNAHRVELYLNGQKIGEKTSTETTTPAGHKYRRFDTNKPYPTFMVNWAAGTLSVRAYDADGNEITEQAKGRKSVTTSSAAVALRANTQHTQIQADGTSLSYVEVDVVDANGHIVTGSEQQIDFTLSGPGRIVGVDNGNPADGSSYKATGRKAFHGKVLVIVQSQRDTGTIELTASATGLTAATQRINVVRATSTKTPFAESVSLSKNYTLTVGQTLNLPSTVDVTYSNGEKRATPITWSTLTAEQLATPGSYDLVGQVEGATTQITAKVTVIHPLVAVENYATSTNRRVAPKLPAFLKAYDVQGNAVIDVPVTWNLRNVSFNRSGEVTVYGTTQLFGQTVRVKALVAVKGEVARSTNIARDPQDMPTFKNGYRRGSEIVELPNAISDSLARLNNGVNNEGSVEAERWTNWALRDDATIDEFFVELNWRQPHDFANINLWHFTDNTFSRLPGDRNVRFEYWDETTQTWKSQEASNITQVSYLEGVTPYGLIAPVHSNKLRIWLRQPAPGKSVGLTEIEVWSHVQGDTKRSLAALASAKLGDTMLHFDAQDTAKFNAQGPLVLEAKTRDNGSATLVPVGHNTYKLVVKSEDGMHTRVYTLVKAADEPIIQDEPKKPEIHELEEINGTVELSHTYTATKQWDTALIEAGLNAPEYLQTEYTIHPTVRHAVYSQGAIRLDQGVNIVIGHDVDLYTRNRLKSILRAYNLSYTTSTAAVANKANIFVGIVGDNSQAEAHQAGANISNGLYDRIDAYSLLINQQGISVVGRDTDAVFYGLTTLKHMLNAKPLPILREITIEDYADIKNRGFIEGYYGNPWSNKDRAELMKFGGELKMTQYFFAPKDDPYHNAKWRELYPEEKLAEIRTLARVGNETKTRYVWTLHPFMNNRIDFSTDATYQQDLNVIKQKFTQLLDAGVREFGILADDASLPVGGYESYNRLMRDITTWLEDKQAQYSGLRKEMIFVPQEYWGSGTEAELQSLNRHLPESSNLTLTGGRIWGEVSTQFLTRLRDNLTANGDTYRPIQLWINWPCTDNSKQHLILGGGDTFLHPNVDPSLIKGIMLNPMQQSEPSKIALFSAAEYTWHVWHSREKAQSVNDMAFNFVESGTFSATDESTAFRELGKHMINQNMDSRVSPLQESVELAPKLEAFLTKFKAGENVSAEREVLRAEFKKLKDAATLYKASGHRRMRKQIHYWLDNTIDQMDALMALLNATEAKEANNSNQLWQNFDLAQKKYDASKQYKFWYVDHYEHAELGVQHIRPFIQMVLAELAKEVDKQMNPEAIVFTYISNRPDVVADASAVLDKNKTTQIVYKTPNSIAVGEYVGVAFNRLIDLHSLVFSMGAISNPRDTFTKADLEYLDANSQWQKITGHTFVGNENDIRLSGLNLKAKGVRLIATTQRPNTWLGIKDIIVNDDYPASTVERLATTVEAGGGLIFTYGTTAQQVTDGDDSTEAMFQNQDYTDTVPAGGWVRLTLPEVKQIKHLRLIQGEHDKLREGVLEYSLDGTNWTVLAELTGQRRVELTTPFEAKYVRLRNARLMENRWLRIADFSLEAAKGTKAYTESDTTTLAETLTMVDGSDYHLQIAPDAVLKPNSYVGLKLDGLFYLKGIENQLTNQHLRVYYSPNKVEWYAAEGLSQAVVNYARYIRVVNLTDTDQIATGNGIVVQLKEIKPTELVDTNFGVSPYYGSTDVRRLQNADALFDGVYNKHVELTDTPQAGSFFTMKLGQTRQVKKLRAYIQDGTHNYLRDGKIQVSENGTDWVDIITIGDGVENAQADQSLTDGYTHDSKNPGNRYIEGVLSTAVNTNYIRVIATAAYSHRFVAFTEFVINDGEYVKPYLDPSVITTAPEARGLDTANLVDRNVLSKFGPQADAGEVVYRLSEKTKANRIRLISNIPTGVTVTVYARVVANGAEIAPYSATVPNKWVELRTVNGSFDTFEITQNPDHVLDVMLVWEGGKPEFNEISTYWETVTQPAVPITEIPDVQVRELTVEKGASVDLVTAVTLPTGAVAEVVEAVNTAIIGEQFAKVKVTFKEGASRIVTVKVTVQDVTHATETFQFKADGILVEVEGTAEEFKDLSLAVNKTVHKTDVAKMIDQNLLDKELDIYELHFANPDGHEVKLQKPMKVTFPKRDHLVVDSVYYIDPANPDEMLEIKALGDHTVTIGIQHFSYYAVVYRSAASNEAPNTPNTPETPNDSGEGGNQGNSGKQDVPSVPNVPDVPNVPNVPDKANEPKQDTQTDTQPQSIDSSQQSPNTITVEAQTAETVQKGTTLPTTSEADTHLIFEAAALAVLAGLGLILKKEDEQDA